MDGSTDDVVAAQRSTLLAWLHHSEPARVQLRETHISFIALQGGRAYKLKKAVRYPFIDLSTVEKRRVACERELALNRRLAPDVYLSVDPVTRAGAIVDHVVVMRRLPDDRRLGSLARHGTNATRCVEALAELLAEFHTDAQTGGEIDRAATRDSVAELWERETEQATAAGCATTARLHARVQRYLAGRDALFARRVARGRARDGHGDLLADDVYCLADAPRALDCLEFDDHLRYGDVLADVAFLAMDLERLQRSDLAQRFLKHYRAQTNDDWPPSLEHFYIAYRAHVRAKVATITGQKSSSRQLIELAERHLDMGRVRLVLVGGSPATGKTTMSRALAQATGWSVFHSDDTRKRLGGLEPTVSSRAPLGTHLYTAEWTEQTYGRLLDRARELLKLGTSVILDASWSNRRHRALATQVARETVSDLVALRCVVPIEVALVRATVRSQRGRDSSDADADLTRQLSASFGPWPEATVVDTSTTLTDAFTDIAAAVGPY